MGHGQRIYWPEPGLRPNFCPTGAVWWARCADLLEQNTFYGSPFHLAEMDANRGVDIG